MKHCDQVQQRYKSCFWFITLQKYVYYTSYKEEKGKNNEPLESLGLSLRLDQTGVKNIINCVHTFFIVYWKHTVFLN